MSRNQVKVGDFTLTITMATLYHADDALTKAGRPSVMATFADVLEQLDFKDGSIDLSAVSGALRVVSFPVLVTLLTEFLRPVHNMSEKKALDGPLSDGLPGDWIVGLFNLLLANVPQSGDVDDQGGDKGEGEPEGNL